MYHHCVLDTNTKNKRLLTELQQAFSEFNLLLFVS
jgi:hypothetical protein